MSEHNDLVIGQFSQQAPSYARLTGDVADQAHADRRAAFARLIGAQSAARALDVCCGAGALALDLAPFVAHVTGVDLTEAMLAEAGAAQVRRGIANAEWRIGDVMALPVPDAAFDLVTAGAAFHHLVDPVGALAEMTRACRPGGTVVIRDVTPLADRSAEYDRIERLRDPSHTHALTTEEMAALGRGLPLGTPELHMSMSGELPFDDVLATSFPEGCMVSELAGILRADAEAGADRLGFAARLDGGRVLVSYRQTTAIWRRM